MNTRKITFLDLALNLCLALKSQIINGATGSGFSSTAVAILTNGNYVITDSYFSDGPIQAVGAVYLV